MISHKTTHEDAAKLWDDIYQSNPSPSSGKPGTLLKRFAEDLRPGGALELGCAKGDDAVWLAGQGWTVLAVDISPTALGYASDNAQRAGVSSRIRFEQHDLSATFPQGTFDLVTASFLHSPVQFERSAALSRAAAAVQRRGHLLIIEHASRAPWSWSPPDTVYPTAEETLESMNLDESLWARVHVGSIERQANGPNGQTASVLDNVIFLRRNGDKQQHG